MHPAFSERIALLRTERALSQRAAASALHISQALLSGYENGTREPGLAFLCRACDFFGVSADYLLGRSEATGGALPAQRKLEETLAALEALCAGLRASLEAPAAAAPGALPAAQQAAAPDARAAQDTQAAGTTQSSARGERA